MKKFCGIKMGRKLIAISLTALTVFSSIGVIALADDSDDFIIDQKVIDVIGGGNGPVWVTIRDEKHYDNEQGYDRIFFEEDSQPFIDENGRTQMPLRAISDELGFSVDWNEAEKKITLSQAEKTVIFYLDNDEFTVNGSIIKMDTTPILVNERTFIPLRFIGEAVGYTVEYTDRNLVEDVPSITTDIEDMWNFDKYNL